MKTIKNKQKAAQECRRNAAEYVPFNLYNLSGMLGISSRANHADIWKALAEAIDPGEDTTMSAYDLLSEEERNALAFVHNSGGTDAVRQRIGDLEKQVADWKHAAETASDATDDDRYLRALEIYTKLLDSETWSDWLRDELRSAAIHYRNLAWKGKK